MTEEPPAADEPAEPELADTFAFLEAHIRVDEPAIDFLIDQVGVFAAVTGLLTAAIGEEQLLRSPARHVARRRRGLRRQPLSISPSVDPALIMYSRSVSESLEDVGGIQSGGVLARWMDFTGSSP
jgi:hypothetical protein